MKKFIIFAILILFSFNSCQIPVNNEFKYVDDDLPFTDFVHPDEVEYALYPLKVGNKWVYEYYRPPEQIIINGSIAGDNPESIKNNTLTVIDIDSVQSKFLPEKFIAATMLFEREDQISSIYYYALRDSAALMILANDTTNPNDDEIMGILDLRNGPLGEPRHNKELVFYEDRFVDLEDETYVYQVFRDERMGSELVFHQSIGMISSATYKSSNVKFSIKLINWELK